jgi:hypothetical protein
LRELLPARAKWKFVLGHLQPVLGERQPVSFFTLGGAVPSLLNTGISAGAEFFSFGSRRGHLGSSFLFRPLQFSKLKNSNCSFRRRVLHGIGFPHNQSSSAAGSRRLLLSCARCSWLSGDARWRSPENILRPQHAQIALLQKSCGQFAERPGKTRSSFITERSFRSRFRRSWPRPRFRRPPRQNGHSGPRSQARCPIPLLAQ